MKIKINNNEYEKLKKENIENIINEINNYDKTEILEILIDNIISRDKNEYILDNIIYSINDIIYDDRENLDYIYDKTKIKI